MKKHRLAILCKLMDQIKRRPRRLRLRQLLQVDFVLSVVEAEQAYPYDFVRRALTGDRRPASADGRDPLLSGAGLIRDLVALADELSKDAHLCAEGWSEPLSSVTDVAQRLNVSTKTIYRWRSRGLACWRFRGPDARLRLLFPEHCVRRFVSHNVALVRRAGGFSQLASAERQRVVARAAELVASGHRTTHALARTIAAETGRAVETIRQTLKNHDNAHAGTCVLRPPAAPVARTDLHAAVWRAYAEGVGVEELARKFERPVVWINSVITQMRARELLARKIDFIWSPEFEGPGADERILNPVLAGPLRQPTVSTDSRAYSALPPYLANLFQIPLLTQEGERVLFRKMNYLKYRAHALVQDLDAETATPAEVDRIQGLLDQAVRVKNDIVQANLRLVVSIARKRRAADQDLFELISDGNVSLMRAVDKFNYARGFKFSTYATWAIVNNFARLSADERRNRRRCTEWNDMLDAVDDRHVEEPNADHLRFVRGTVDHLLAHLSTRERTILRGRYGLNGHGGPQTLAEIGRDLGLSKERVRQLQAKALLALRTEFADDAAQLLGA